MRLTKNDDMIQALAADRPNLIVENKRHPLYDKHALGRVYDREKTNRRECLDHVIVLGEAHLRRILKSYADYYNSVRTHRSLHKDAPISRPIHQTGIIRSHPILGGLHHHYVRV